MTYIIDNKGNKELFNEEKYSNYVRQVAQDINLNYDLDKLIDKNIKNITAKKEYTTEELNNLSILNTLDYNSRLEPNWTYLASAFFLNNLYNKAAINRNYNSKNKYGSLLDLVLTLNEKGIYSNDLLTKYTASDFYKLEKEILPERDNLFTYLGLKMLADRYLATDKNKNVYELPQERWMIIAMTLMQDESKDKKLDLVKEAYWALSNLYMTVATPTLSNAGKTYGQLSSCFIDTVADDLTAIYDNNTDMAIVSKNGGGVGTYLGKIRARGSDIKGFKNNSSGVIPWMKQLNNTAVSVDQLGQRQGAFAVYLDVWHKDIFPFLDAKLNNGDERQRTHDIFTGVCIPDIFMEQVEKRGKWHLFDPKNVLDVMGWSLEDFYDEEVGNGSFRQKYLECIEHPDIDSLEVDAIEIMKRVMRSQLETGTPFMFYRDTVNRANANKHAGMIYCTNLCTEIVQNMSATTRVEEYTVDGKIIIEKTPGDFVVCNLSSINLGRAVGDKDILEKDDILSRLIPIQVRMLDNVIDLNNLPILQGQLTNKKYRPVGLGTFGWHHTLALQGIKWESEEAVEFADKLYEKIAYLTIEASMLLAQEKGSYPMYEGSEWQTGEYFDRKGYYGDINYGDDFSWDELSHAVSKFGIRNGYLMAVAPNSSTALIAGSTPSIDPIFKQEYSEEKKDYKIPVTAPDLNAKTTWLYKSGYHIDQLWSIKQNIARQKHIDQAISFNLYVSNSIKASELLNFHLTAWNGGNGMKTTYYIRSQSQAVINECDSCSS